MYHLRIESGAQSGERIDLPTGEDEPVLTLGRGPEMSIRFSDSTMSRLQAELRWEDGAWHLVNKSRHGSYVGRKLLTPDSKRRLRGGDILVLGETKMTFVEEVLATPGQDPLTPETPTIARAPTLAGYDADGLFHMGQTLMDIPDDTQGSFIYLAGGPGSQSGAVKVKKRRLYFFGILMLLGLIGCVAMGALIVLPTLLKHAGAMVLATAFGFLPLIPYLFLIKFLDRNDQIPWKNILACVLWGGTVGCGFSLVLNTAGRNVLMDIMAAGDAWSVTAILVAPLVEEVIKGGAVLVLFLMLHDEFDNVLEGLILGAASGLGFALVENCIYNVRFLTDGGMAALGLMGTYRMLVNALIGHPVYTAMTGAGLGLLREIPRDRLYRYVFPFLGLFTAIGMHVVWNGAAVFIGKLIGGTGLLTLVLNAVVFGGAGLLFFVAAYVFAARRERRVLVTYLAEEVGKGFVEPDELDSFQKALGRLRYELGGMVRHGFKVYLRRKALRRAQVELAFRKWHLAQGDVAKGKGDFDRYIMDARMRIRDARNTLNQLEGRERAPTQRARPVKEVLGGDVATPSVPGGLETPTPSHMKPPEPEDP